MLPGVDSESLSPFSGGFQQVSAAAERIARLRAEMERREQERRAAAEIERRIKIEQRARCSRAADLEF
jgi:hypothetical protein